MCICIMFVFNLLPIYISSLAWTHLGKFSRRTCPFYPGKNQPGLSISEGSSLSLLNSPDAWVGGAGFLRIKPDSRASVLHKDT